MLPASPVGFQAEMRRPRETAAALAHLGYFFLLVELVRPEEVVAHRLGGLFRILVNNRVQYRCVLIDGQLFKSGEAH